MERNYIFEEPKKKEQGMNHILNSLTNASAVTMVAIVGDCHRCIPYSLGQPINLQRLILIWACGFFFNSYSKNKPVTNILK